eukprot:CAMPEP_0169421244 /NCGR_PEP_ID=MMETSP1017-20121227/66185_1 /TAXON_ID=342587 /ORGANISM="Karlodinium micrum, Strain CCMP2283" /LENGTH=50 /DNA_ID=CAMNT_0009530511 /DNA_START=94 /DNA_END=242 /DNA_ORIENTATION=-
MGAYAIKSMIGTLGLWKTCNQEHDRHIGPLEKYSIAHAVMRWSKTQPEQG